MAKKIYPGGFRLTLATARRLAMQEFGTAKGLEAEPGMPEGYFRMLLGNLGARIRPDVYYNSGCILLMIDMNGSMDTIYQFYDRNTLEQNVKEDELHHRVKRREMLHDWVLTQGVEYCHRRIDMVANSL